MTEDDDYIECLQVHYSVCDYVDILSELFKELKDVSKQVLGPCPKNLKDEVKKLTTDRKTRMLKAKDDAKKEKELIKQAEKLKIIQE